jgi:hypothetical protein
VPHAFATHCRRGQFDATRITDKPSHPLALVFPARTGPVSRWPEDALTEKAVFHWPLRSIIDGLRLCDLAVALAANALWAGKTDTKTTDGVEGSHGSFLCSLYDRCV